MWNVRKSRPTSAELDSATPAADPRLVTLGDAGAFEKRDAKTDLKVEGDWNVSGNSMIEVARKLGC